MAQGDREEVSAAAASRRVRRLGGGNRPKGFKASAKRMPLDDGKALAKLVAKRLEWQDEAWEYFDEVPEVKYSVWFLGNAMGKLRLFAAVRSEEDPDSDPIPVTDPKSGIPTELASRAALEVDRLKSPLGGQGEICRELNMNLEVAAEGYLVGIGPRVSSVKDEVTNTTVEVITPEEWSIRSVSEVEVEGSGKSTRYRVKESPGDKGVLLDPKRDTIIRIWQRHPRWSFLQDNNMRGVLEECARLVQLGHQITAESKSAMSGGIITLPNQLSQTPIEDDPESGEEQVDPLEEEIESALTDPVEDPSSASAVSPLPLRGDAEFLKPEYVRHITFERPGSAVLEERIQKRVERIARGMNLPVEVVLGHQQTTFSNARQVDEDTFEDHLQPRCELICDALTVAFLRPNLEEAGFDPTFTDRIIVWYDPVRLIKQADPIENVQAALAEGLISDEAARRLWGFDEDDAPSPEERLIRTVMHLRSFDPGVSTAILKLLGVPLDIPAELPGSGAPSGQASIENALEPFILELVMQRQKLAAEKAELLEKVTASRSTPRQRARLKVGKRLLSIDQEFRARLLTAADGVLTRALTRAGNRLKSKKNKGHQDLRSLVTRVHALYAAAHVGPTLVAAAGFTDDDLIGADAWDELEGQFFEWGASAQRQALEVVKDVVGLTDASRAELESRQFSDLTEAWSWMKDTLHDLAVARLYGPDPHAPELGEFDPSSKVPTGLIRQAITRAGGANGLTVQGGNPLVVLNNGSPPGGIGTGQLVMEQLAEGGAETDGYEWEYGPAYRKSPFEDHEALDGLLFQSFESDELSADGSFVDSSYFYPGDHDGCVCDVAPVILGPDDVVFNAASGEGHTADAQPEE